VLQLLGALLKVKHYNPVWPSAILIVSIEPMYLAIQDTQEQIVPVFDVTLPPLAQETIHNVLHIRQLELVNTVSVTQDGLTLLIATFKLPVVLAQQQIQFVLMTDHVYVLLEQVGQIAQHQTQIVSR